MLNWIESNLDRFKLDCNLARSTPFCFISHDGTVISRGKNLREAINEALVNLK